MAWFTVQYRGADGKTESVQIESADRAGVFAELKKRGISAVRIEDGPVKNKRRKAQAADVKSKSKQLFSVAIVSLIVGLVCLLIWFIGEDVPEVLEKTKNIEKPMTAQPKQAPKPARQDIVTKPDPVVKTNFVNGVWYDEKGRPHYKPARIIHSGSNTVINGKAWVPPRQIFHRVSEVELDRVLSAKPGERIIGDTNWKLFDQDIRAALIEPIKIEPDDTEEEVARKEAVRAAKKELAAAIGEGESPSEILRATRDEVNKLADLYDNLNRSLYELKTSEETSEEDMELAIEAANKMLESNRIYSKRFRTPAELRAKEDEARQRKLLKQNSKQ